MKCPKCGGKSTVKNTLHDNVMNETYRQIKCLECGLYFYSIEFEVEFNDAYRDRFLELKRDVSRNRVRKCRKNKKEKE